MQECCQFGAGFRRAGGPLDRRLQAVVAPEQLVAGEEARRAEDPLSRCALDLAREPRTPPVAFDEGVRHALAEEAARLGVEAVELPSGAGHDAGILAAAGVASGMLFVRSLAGGVSHHPDEESSPEDVALAIDVLAATLNRLASSTRIDRV
jgi:N-carbamoyl-L-amino-acid hydrolase